MLGGWVAKLELTGSRKATLTRLIFRHHLTQSTTGSHEGQKVNSFGSVGHVLWYTTSVLPLKLMSSRRLHSENGRGLCSNKTLLTAQWVHCLSSNRRPKVWVSLPHMLDKVGYTYNPSTREMGTRGSEVWGHPQLHSKLEASLDTQIKL